MARNVFLSFVEEDLNLVNLFRGQAKNENNDLEFSDYSVKEPFDSKNADYIRQQIRNLIKKVSVTLCLIGETTYKSRWVDWEITTSAELGKGLVGVRLHSSPKDIIPQALKDNKAEIVDWDIKKIVQAIERAAKKAGY
jgi:DNA-directed RNA polymerase subunit L